MKFYEQTIAACKVFCKPTNSSKLHTAVNEHTFQNHGLDQDHPLLPGPTQ